MKDFNISTGVRRTLCSFNSNFKLSSQQLDTDIKTTKEQECILVGCVPAAHWLYAAVFFRGGSPCQVPGGGGSAWSEGGILPARSRGGGVLSMPGPGGFSLPGPGGGGFSLPGPGGVLPARSGGGGLFSLLDPRGVLPARSRGGGPARRDPPCEQNHTHV